MNGSIPDRGKICPVCDNAECLIQLLELHTGHIYCCLDCKTLTYLPTPSEVQLKSAYQKFNAGEIAREEFESYVAISKRIIERDLKTAGVDMRKGLTMLDYGCGGGHFVQAANQLGIDAVGIDVDEEGARFGRELGLRIATGDHRGLAPVFGDAKYDVILMMHVLEHVPNPATVLRAMHARLNEGGILIVRVPDQTSFPSKLKQALRKIGIKQNEYGFVQPPIHLHGFREDTFRYVSKAHGLDLLALYKASPLDLLEFPTTERYWHNLGIQRIVYRLGRLIGSGGNLTAIMRTAR